MLLVSSICNVIVIAFWLRLPDFAYRKGKVLLLLWWWNLSVLDIYQSANGDQCWFGIEWGFHLPPLGAQSLIWPRRVRGAEQGVAFGSWVLNSLEKIVKVGDERFTCGTNNVFPNNIHPWCYFIKNFLIQPFFSLQEKNFQAKIPTRATTSFV